MKQIWAIALGCVLMLGAVAASGVIWRSEDYVPRLAPDAASTGSSGAGAGAAASIAPQQATLPVAEASPAPTAQQSQTSASTAVPADAVTSAVIENIKNKAQLLDALDSVIAFGEGEAGISLKTAIAVSALLDWAQKNAFGSDVQAIARTIGDWIHTLAPADAVRFYENWPNVYELGLIVCRDTGSYKTLFGDAGAPLTLERYDPTNFQRLGSAMDWLLDK